jgi:hypothetical protein
VSTIFGEHINAVTATAQGYRIAFIHAATLVGVEVGLIEAHQAQVETEGLSRLSAASRFGCSSQGSAPAHQSTKAGGPCQLLTDKLHIGDQPQRLFQLVVMRVFPAGLPQPHLTATQVVARTAVEASLRQRRDLHRNTE